MVHACAFAREAHTCGGEKRGGADDCTRGTTRVSFNLRLPSAREEAKGVRQVVEEGEGARRRKTKERIGRWGGGKEK